MNFEKWARITITGGITLKSGEFYFFKILMGLPTDIGFQKRKEFEKKTVNESLCNIP